MQLNCQLATTQLNPNNDTFTLPLPFASEHLGGCRLKGFAWMPPARLSAPLRPAHPGYHHAGLARRLQRRQRLALRRRRLQLVEDRLPAPDARRQREAV